jgi:hypothetical protein
METKDIWEPQTPNEILCNLARALIAIGEDIPPANIPDKVIIDYLIKSGVKFPVKVSDFKSKQESI